MVTVELTPFDNEAEAFSRGAKLLRVDKSKVKIVKKSIDARHKNNIKIIYQLDKLVEEPTVYPRVETNSKAVVVGAGPAGLFAALTLIRSGVSVTVIERGSSVENRSKIVDTFKAGGAHCAECNVLFGEGGAGTFSDGKLNTGVNNRLIGGVLKDFVSFGAPQDILYLSKPHIGSDKLKSVVKNMRNHIIDLGGTFLFDRLVTDFVVRNGRIVGVITKDGVIEADHVILAIGHSARDTYKTLFDKGVKMEQKDFAVGFRVEQLQSVINEQRYGKFAGFNTLPPADYKLVSHASDRGVFTFCMCPGGEVVPSVSEEGYLAVNGMSDYLRDGKNANSAVIAQVTKRDFENDNPLAGIAFQRMIEKRAYILGGENYHAPVMLCDDFIKGATPKAIKGVLPTYRRGFVVKSLENLYPKSITESLKAGLYDMDKKIKGFASNGAVLTGVETRTSAPVRILRDESLQSVSVKGLYPCGEGAGYAGGIMSAALDGIRVANAIILKEGGKCPEAVQ